MRWGFHFYSSHRALSLVSSLLHQPFDYGVDALMQASLSNEMGFVILSGRHFTMTNS